MCFDDENESVVSAQQETVNSNVKVGDTLEIVASENRIGHCYKPGDKVTVKYATDGYLEVKRENDSFTQSIKPEDYKKIEAAPETGNAEKPIKGEGLTHEQQLKFEMLVAILVAQPMGYGPEDKELQDRLELTAESLEAYRSKGSRVFKGDNAQTAFENAVGDVAITLGVFKDTPELGSAKQLASAIRAFVSNLRLALKKGIYDNVAA